MNPVSAHARCPPAVSASIPNCINSASPGYCGEAFYVYPPGVGSALASAGIMLAHDRLSEGGLEDFVRYLAKPVPQHLRGDTVAAMLRDARWSREQELVRQYDAEMAIVRYVRKALQWGTPIAEITDEARDMAGVMLTRTEVLAILRGCAIDHAERIRRIAPDLRKVRR